MTDEEKEAIEGLKKDLLIHECWGLNNLGKIFKISHLHSLRVVLNLIEKQQAEIEKKDKIIDEMAENIVRSDSDLCEYIDLTYKNNKCQVGSDCKQCIKEYFTKKVEGEQNDKI